MLPCFCSDLWLSEELMPPKKRKAKGQPEQVASNEEGKEGKEDPQVTGPSAKVAKRAPDAKQDSDPDTKADIPAATTILAAAAPAMPNPRSIRANADGGWTIEAATGEKFVVVNKIEEKQVCDRTFIGNTYIDAQQIERIRVKGMLIVRSVGECTIYDVDCSESILHLVPPNSTFSQAPGSSMNIGSDYRVEGPVTVCLDKGTIGGKMVAMDGARVSLSKTMRVNDGFIALDKAVIRRHM